MAASTFVTGAGMGLEAAGNSVVTAAVAAAFLLPWLLSPVSEANAARVTTDGPRTARPGSADSTGQLPARVPSMAGPAPIDAHMAAPGSGTASRWTRTFGPPETGQLPVQPYIEPAAAGMVANQQTPHQQWSHSAL
jgi:hypothetical protein